METRYLVETGLDVHVVSNVEKDGDFLKMTIINPSKVSTMKVHIKNVVSVIKETVHSEDLTKNFIKELLPI